MNAPPYMGAERAVDLVRTRNRPNDRLERSVSVGLRASQPTGRGRPSRAGSACVAVCVGLWTVGGKPWAWAESGSGSGGGCGCVGSSRHDEPGRSDAQHRGSPAKLAGQYDAVLCDVWGVLHDGRSVFPGAADALIGLRAAGVQVVLLTNMPRPSSTMPAALGRLGFPDDAWDAIVTSGDAIRGAARASGLRGRSLRLGRDTDRGLWDGLGLEFVADPDRARFAAIAGLRTTDGGPGRLRHHPARGPGAGLGAALRQPRCADHVRRNAALVRRRGG